MLVKTLCYLFLLFYLFLYIILSAIFVFYLKYYIFIKSMTCFCKISIQVLILLRESLFLLFYKNMDYFYFRERINSSSESSPFRTSSIPSIKLSLALVLHRLSGTCILIPASFTVSAACTKRSIFF